MAVPAEAKCAGRSMHAVQEVAWIHLDFPRLFAPEIYGHELAED